MNVTLIDSTTIKARIYEFAEQLNSEHELQNSIFICVMNGAFIFFSDLIRHLPDTVDTDFVRVSSYGATKTSGLLDMIYPYEKRVFNKHVFIVDDILDSGSTLKFISNDCIKHGASSVHTISLLARKRSIKLSNHYSLFSIDDEWVYGYGMDLYGTKRNNPNIMYIEQNVE